jgi:anhydro-N-acetylmuramic acid kinase
MMRETASEAIMSHRTFIGLAPTSSLLGVDAALVRAEGLGFDVNFKLEHFTHLPYGSELRELLWRVDTSPSPELRHVGTLHRVLGETYALAVKQLLKESKRSVNDVLCIGCPGQTLWHDAAGRYPASLGLGMMGVLAERTGLTVVSDVAGRDMALGGQGGPMNALVDAQLFHRAGEHRVHLHLGSVASIVSLPAQLGVNWRNVVGFEAAPATLLLDGLMRLMTNAREQFDAGGKHAVQGKCLEPLLERWMQNHFFHERPPRCVPRREFGPAFLNRSIEQAQRQQGNLHDVLCTMTHFVAQAIVHALQTYVAAKPARILLSGRGVRNGFLWHLLEQKLAPTPLEKTDVHGIPSEACEAIACAGLAALTMDGVPANLPSVTGATGPRVLGQLTPGASGNWARCLTWMARQASPLQAAA